MQKDGTQSWIVISRGVHKCATELPEENKKPIHCEEAPSSTGKSEAMQQKEQLKLSSSSPTTLPINQRKWNDKSAVGRIDGRSNLILKLITRFSRHQGYPRQDDGALEWRTLSLVVHREHREVEKWTKQVWQDCREKGSHKNRIQYCGDSSSYFLYMRAIQGDSGGNKVAPSLQDKVKNPFNWTDYICHVGSSHDCKSVVGSGLIAGEKIKSTANRFFSGPNARVHNHSGNVVQRR